LPMRKLLILTFFLPLMAWAQSSLPPCLASGVKHNCFGTTALPNFGMYVGEFRNDKTNGAGMFVMTALSAPAAPFLDQPMAQVKTQTHTLDGHRVKLDFYPAVGIVRGAAILSHGFTRSRRTLAGHAQALADTGVLALAPDLPCTFDFRCNASALAALVGMLRAGGTFGAPVERVMLVGFSAGGLSSLLAAHTLGVVGYVGLDPFDRMLPGEAERLGLAAARQLRTEALLLRAPPSRCNAEAVATPWAAALPALWRDELIAGASHCDFESPTDWMCRIACGNTEPTRQQRVRQVLLEAALRWLR